MMEALRVMTYFKVSLSTCNWDSAIKNGRLGARFYRLYATHPFCCQPSGYL